MKLRRQFSTLAPLRMFILKSKHSRARRLQNDRAARVMHASDLCSLEAASSAYASRLLPSIGSLSSLLSMLIAYSRMERLILRYRDAEFLGNADVPEALKLISL